MSKLLFTKANSFHDMKYCQVVMPKQIKAWSLINILQWKKKRSCSKDAVLLICLFAQNKTVYNKGLLINIKVYNVSNLRIFNNRESWKHTMIAYLFKICSEFSHTLRIFGFHFRMLFNIDHFCFSQEVCTRKT